MFPKFNFLVQQFLNENEKKNRDRLREEIRNIFPHIITEFKTHVSVNHYEQNLQRQILSEITNRFFQILIDNEYKEKKVIQKDKEILSKEGTLVWMKKITEVFKNSKRSPDSIEPGFEQEKIIRGGMIDEIPDSRIPDDVSDQSDKKKTNLATRRKIVDDILYALNPFTKERKIISDILTSNNVYDLTPLEILKKAYQDLEYSGEAITTNPKFKQFNDTHSRFVNASWIALHKPDKKEEIIEFAKANKKLSLRSLKRNILNLSIFVLINKKLANAFPSLFKPPATNINTTQNFPDPNFRICVETIMGVEPGGEFTAYEASLITKIDLSIMKVRYNIYNLTGIEHFTNITHLNLKCNRLTKLDISNNTALTHLVCKKNYLTELDISKNSALTHLDCSENKLTKLDISNNTALTYLDCGENKLTELDISKNSALTSLSCRYNKLTELDISKNYVLNILICRLNNLSKLDISNNTNLTRLDCSVNELTELEISNNTDLISLNCRMNKLAKIDIAKNTALTGIDCGTNVLTELNISNNNNLTILNCYHNKLTLLDISNNTALTALSCSTNKLTELDITNNTALTHLVCKKNYLTELDISKNSALTHLYCNENKLTKLDISNNTALTALNCSEDILTELDISNNVNLTYLDCNELKLSRLSNMTRKFSKTSNPICYMKWV